MQPRNIRFSLAILLVPAILSVLVAGELPLKQYDVVRLAEGVHGIVWQE